MPIARRWAYPTQCHSSISRWRRWLPNYLARCDETRWLSRSQSWVSQLPSQTFFFWIWILFGLNLDTQKVSGDIKHCIKKLPTRSIYLDHRGYQIPWFLMIFDKSFEEFNILTKQYYFWMIFTSWRVIPGGEIFPYQFRIASHPQKPKNDTFPSKYVFFQNFSQKSSKIIEFDIPDGLDR